MNNQAKHYFEAHVTIDPVVGADRDNVEEIAHCNQFKLARLLMARGLPSTLDTFMTGHATQLDLLTLRLRSLVASLRASGYKVRRYKIEDTVLDSRVADELELLT